jgi:hypothetical protein
MVFLATGLKVLPRHSKKSDEIIRIRISLADKAGMPVIDRV